MRHIFDRAGIEITSDNKKEIDKLVHTIVGVKYKNCPAAWKEAKRRIAENEEDFASRLKELYSKQL